MSFRTAHNDLRNRRNNTNHGLNRGLIRDNTPEEERRKMDAYYKRMRVLSGASLPRKYEE